LELRGVLAFGLTNDLYKNDASWSLVFELK